MRQPRLTLLPARNTEAWITALAGFCLIFFCAPSIGISPDSVTYTSVARSLTTHGQPIEFDGEWLVDFPLGYPVLLAVVSFITRSDPFHFGLILNSLLFGLLVFLCVRETRRNQYPPWMRVLYGLCLLFSPALLQVYSLLWSETLFILCIALFFIACRRYGRDHDRRALWAMILTTAIACVTRYAGITVLATGLFLLITDRQLPNRKKALHSILYTGLGLSLLLTNLLINRIHEGYLTGDRIVNRVSLSEHLQRFGATLLRWAEPSFPPTGEGYSVLAAGTAIVFIGAAALGVWFVWRNKRSLYSWAGVGAIFTLIYSLFLLGMALLTAFQPLDSRLLSPLWIPALGAAAGVAARASLSDLVHARLVPRAAFRFRPILAASAVVVFCYAGAAKQLSLLVHPENVYRDHIRYDFRAFEKSSTLEFVRTHPAIFRTDKPVYSNAGEVLYVLDTLETGYPPQLNNAEEMDDFRSDSASLIWLNDIHVYPDEFLRDLRQQTPLYPLETFPDGVIFSNRPAH